MSLNNSDERVESRATGVTLLWLERALHIWAGKPLSGREFRLLAALAVSAEITEEGLARCIAKREQLSTVCGLGSNHVSAVLRSLTFGGFISAVRIGRRNVYYLNVPPLLKPLPPDEIGFFRQLATQGVILRIPSVGLVQYEKTSKAIEEVSPLERAVFSDYVNGLLPARLAEAVHLAKAASEA